MRVFICLLLGLAASADAREIDLVVHNEPLSLCGGSIRDMAKRVESYQPKNYKDPSDVKPRPDLLTYRKLIPSSLFIDEGSPRVEIAPVIEIPGTHLILASERELMNYLLKRASSWIEGNNFLDNDEKFFTSGNLVISAGQDLQSKQLQAFYDLFMKEHLRSPLPLDENLKIRAQVERKFWSDFLVPLLKQSERTGKEFVLISSPAGKNMTESIAGHEVLHARYFLEEDYRKACDEYWQTKVPREDKLIFYGALHSYEMIELDQVLASNEFQAYMLMPGAKDVRYIRLIRMKALWPLVLMHQESLNTFLLERGIRPLKIKLKW